MSATLIVRHTVADYSSWLVVYKDAETIRSKPCGEVATGWRARCW